MTATFVSLSEFVATDEPGADPLLGEDGDVLVPQGGDLMVYGDGGAGKTTLCIDLAFHFAAGDPWCGIEIPQPLRVGIIENEGPRPLFRQKLKRKLDAWTGSDLADRMHVLDNPWAVFRFDNEQHRTWLAHSIADLDLDVLFVGPLTRVGMNEAGTLQETRDFSGLLENVRAQAGRPITFVLVHHQNKGGQVSGAWEGAGDTLLHVTAQGHGKTRVHVQKARWASSWHGKSIQLVWADGEGFLVADAPQRDANTIADEILAAVLGNGGCSWNDVEKTITGNAAKARAVRDQLLESGQLLDANAGTGRRSKLLWHPDDPVRPVRLDADALADAHEGDGAVGVTASLRPSLKGRRTLDAPAPSTDDTEIERLSALGDTPGLTGLDAPETDVDFTDFDDQESFA